MAAQCAVKQLEKEETKIKYPVIKLARILLSNNVYGITELQGKNLFIRSRRHIHIYCTSMIRYMFVDRIWRAATKIVKINKALPESKLIHVLKMEIWMAAAWPVMATVIF